MLRGLTVDSRISRSTIIIQLSLYCEHVPFSIGKNFSTAHLYLVLECHFNVVQVLPHYHEAASK